MVKLDTRKAPHLPGNGEATVGRCLHDGVGAGSERRQVYVSWDGSNKNGPKEGLHESQRWAALGWEQAGGGDEAYSTEWGEGRARLPSGTRQRDLVERPTRCPCE